MAIDGADGKVLGQRLYNIRWNGPTVVDDVLYAVDDRHAAAYEMPQSAQEGMKLKQLWETDIKRDLAYLVHGGLVYAISGNGGRTLTVLEAKTGKKVYEQRLPFRGRRVYSSVTQAGEQLMLNSERGETLIFKPGRQFEQVALNQVGQYRSTPVLDGDKILIRTKDHLWCIGRN